MKANYCTTLRKKHKKKYTFIELEAKSINLFIIYNLAIFQPGNFAIFIKKLQFTQAISLLITLLQSPLDGILVEKFLSRNSSTRQWLTNEWIFSLQFWASTTQRKKNLQIQRHHLRNQMIADRESKRSIFKTIFILHRSRKNGRCQNVRSQKVQVFVFADSQINFIWRELKYLFSIMIDFIS